MENTLIMRLLNDIKELRDNLEYMNDFILKLPEDKLDDFYIDVSILHTDIMILKNKTKHK